MLWGHIGISAPWLVKSLQKQLQALYPGGWGPLHLSLPPPRAACDWQLSLAWERGHAGHFWKSSTAKDSPSPPALLTSANPGYTVATASCQPTSSSDGNSLSLILILPPIFLPCLVPPNSWSVDASSCTGAMAKRTAALLTAAAVTELLLPGFADQQQLCHSLLQPQSATATSLQGF